MSAAERARRRRARASCGRAVLSIEVDLFSLADMLVSTGWLAEWDSDDRAAITAATSALVETVTRDGAEFLAVLSRIHRTRRPTE